ncbi:MAG: DMT family transporter [Sneathiellales bacterium]|nr:DMT family transporter [Sneathiellales bacterium]
MQRRPVPFLFAVVTILAAIMLYDVMSATVKHLSSDYPVQQLALLRNVIGMVPTLFILFWSQDWVKDGRPITIRQWKLALFRGILGIFAQIFFYLAVSRLEFATAVAIVFAGPFFVTMLSIPILGHRVRIWRWLAVLIGFTGVLLVIQPTTDSFTWYALLPLCAALGFASTSVSSQLFDKTTPTALINLYANGTGVIGTFALVFFTTGFVPVLAFEDWLFIGMMGLAGGLASYCIISAYRLAEPSSLSPFEYFGIPFSFFLGWFFFGEAPLDQLLPGVFLIIGGGLLIIWREHYQKATHSD